VLLGIAALVGVSIQTPTAASTFRSISWGLVQEAILLGYFFQRWRALLQNTWLAAAANSLVFGLFHAPEMALVAVASFGSFFFNWLFLRNPNVFLIGIAHGVFSILALPLMIGTGVMPTGRIGPAELALLRNGSRASGATAIASAFARVCSLKISSKRLSPKRSSAFYGANASQRRFKTLCRAISPATGASSA